MTKDEFIGKFSDKDKIEIAEKYLGMMYDQMMRNDYCQIVAQSNLDVQDMDNTIQRIVGTMPPVTMLY